MRKWIVIAGLLVLPFIASGQSGFNHFSYKGGSTLEGDFNFEVAYVFNLKYYNNVSLFFSGFVQDFSKSKWEEKNWTFGVYYEPNVLQSRNSLLNFKFGTSAGTNETNFIFDVIAGLEYNYAISRNTMISVFAKNNYMFNSDIGFRHALLVGLQHRF